MWENFFESFTIGALEKGLSVLLVLAVILVLLLIIKVIFKRILSSVEGKKYHSGRAKRIKTLAMIFQKVLYILVIVVGALVILSELGIDLAPILTVVGIAGLAVSFGAQALVKDVISGVFLLVENQVRVGDIVQIDSHSGQVEELTLRVIRIRDVNGEMHIIPNGNISSIINKTKNFSRRVFDIGVAYREDVDRVMQVIREVGDGLAADPQYSDLITEPFEVWGLDSFGDSAVYIKARVTTVPAKQWEIAREFNRRLKIRFDQEGIEIPFPQRVIHHRGGGKQGAV